MMFLEVTPKAQSKGLVRLVLTPVLLAGAFLVPSTAFCERLLDSLPMTEDFNHDNYQDIVESRPSATKGSRHEWVSDGGWQGSGAAKFFPSPVNDAYAGLRGFNQIYGSTGSEQINVRFLIYHGSEFYKLSHVNKVVIMNRADGWDRPMLLGWDMDGTWRTYGICDDSCRFGSGGNWPQPGDRFKIGPSPHRSGEWISVEFEANVRTGVQKLYIDTQDGELSGLYVEKTFTHDPTGDPLLHAVDVIGGYFNMGSAAHPDNYYMIDELVIDDGYIGPPDGFVDQYYVLNPRLVSASVMSLADDNVITAGDRTLNLDLYERAGLSSPNGPVLSPGMTISGTGPFDLGSATDGTDTPAHVSMLGTEFVMPHIRNSHIYQMMSPNSDATVEITVDGTVHRRTLPEGSVVNFNAGNSNGNVSAVITSDAPIVVSHRAVYGSNQHNDALTVPPASRELWGIRSTAAFIGAVEDNTHVTVYASNGATSSLTLDAGERRQVDIGSGSEQGAGSAIHLVADKPINAVQGIDGDGNEVTAFYPTAKLRNRFGIPKNSQYIAIACPQADTRITLYKPSGDPVTKTCNGNGNIPGKAYFGRSDANVMAIPQGSYLESTKPIHVVHEVTASQDEHNLIGAPSM
jgi:hypothetical protein